MIRALIKEAAARSSGSRTCWCSPPRARPACSTSGHELAAHDRHVRRLLLRRQRHLLLERPARRRGRPGPPHEALPADRRPASCRINIARVAGVGAASHRSRPWRRSPDAGRPWPCIAVYIVITLLYTLWLKHVAVIDIVTVAAGFVLRAVAGAVAVDVPMRGGSCCASPSARCSSSPASATRSCARSATTRAVPGPRSRSTASATCASCSSVSLGGAAGQLLRLGVRDQRRRPTSRLAVVRADDRADDDRVVPLSARARIRATAPRPRRSSPPTVCCSYRRSCWLVDLRSWPSMP